MIDLAKILRHNVIARLFNHLLVFLINIIIVHRLGAGQSGSYFNQLYLLNMVVFIFSMGLDYMAIGLLARDPAYLLAIRRMFLYVLAIFTTFLLIAGGFIQHFQPGWLSQSTPAIICFGLGNLLLIFYQGILSAQRHFNLQNLLLIITNVVFLGFMLLTPAMQMLPNVAMAYGLLFLVQGLCMFFAARQKARLPFKKLETGTFFRRGFFIMASSLAYFAFLRIDNFFVEKYASPVVLGNYVQCGKIGQYFIYFSSIISSTLLPFIAKETVGSSYKDWKDMMRPYFLLISFSALALGATGRWLFPFLFGPEFTEMHKLMLLMLPGYVALGLLTLLNSVYIGKGNIRRIFIGDVAGLLLVAILDWWLVPQFGAYAAAIISSIAYILLFVFLIAGFRQQFIKVADY